jgi:hypothetical protein
MLLLYPGELYRLLGASSFIFSYKTTLPNGTTVENSLKMGVI